MMRYLVISRILKFVDVDHDPGRWGPVNQYVMGQLFSNSTRVSKKVVREFRLTEDILHQFNDELLLDIFALVMRRYAAQR